MSRADPVNDKTNGPLTPRPFDQGTFSKYLSNVKGSEVTVAVQAAARKADIDKRKATIGPLPWFNVWAESALLLSVLSKDGTGKGVQSSTIQAFFTKGTLPGKPSGSIGMAALTKLTAELIYEGYKNDLTGLASLLKRFATQGVSNAIKGVDIASIGQSVVTKLGADKAAASIKQLFGSLKLM